MAAERELIERDETADRTAAHDRSLAIDGLRGVAALLVALAHTGFLPHGDYTPAGGVSGVIQSLSGAGVLLFFSISGYLIAGPHLRALVAGAPLPDARAYLLRRVTRIYPAYWIAFVGVFVVGTAHVGDVAGYQWPVHLTLLQSSWPKAGEATAVFFVAWTLGIEIAFYLFVPVAAWVLRRVHPGPWALGRLAALISGGALVTAVWTIVSHTHDESGVRGGLAVNGLWNWLYAFAPGMLLALVALAPGDGRAAAWHRFARRWALTLPLVAALWAGAYGLGRSTHPSVAYLSQDLYVLASGLLLASVLSSPGHGPALLRALAPAGLVSYGIYLWHSLVVDVLIRHDGLTVQGGLAAYAVDVVIVVAITAPIAAGSWYLVERPGIRAAARWARGRRRAPAAAVPVALS